MPSSTEPQQEVLDSRRDIVYERLTGFAHRREAYYRDQSKINLNKLLDKDVVMFAARGVQTAHEFVDEAFHACESSSEETVMGVTWQSIITAISSDTLDTGDMMTARDGDLYICELKSQTNTTNSSSFPQELRELKEKCEIQRRYRRADNSRVLPAFCVLRSRSSVDEWRVYHADERSRANRDINGFAYRYLEGSAFWRWLTGFNSVEGLVDDVSKIDVGEVREAREECWERLHQEMTVALAEYSLDDSIAGVLELKRLRGGAR